MNERKQEKPEGKPFQAIRVREGDLIELGPWVLEFATYEGHDELRVPKEAGAKVRKRLTRPAKEGYDSP